MKLSAVIITFNEQSNIGRCIDSLLEVSDEIVVLDSYSTDNTRFIAESKGAKVYLQSFLGYIEQKNEALKFATYDLVLSLDADEALDKTLQTSIMKAKEKGLKDIYAMNRCANYCGTFIKHGTWYPDVKIRLYNKSEARWGGSNPHDKIIIKSPKNIVHLKGDILHYSYASIHEHVMQNNHFSTISAVTLYEKGWKTSLFKLIFHPLWAFILSFIIKKGFLDGFYGFIIAIQVANLSFLKHATLYQKQKHPTGF
jgi:glycosyltransferase involved in cell wall biosynthesis